MFRRVAILLIVFMLNVSALHAKHRFTKPVPPIISNGVKYSATGEGRAEYVLATDVATGNPLWKVAIFRTHIKPWIEEDTQWVYITELRMVDSALYIKDEKSRCYLLDLATRHVKKRHCL